MVYGYGARVSKFGTVSVFGSKLIARALLIFMNIINKSQN